jgi:uncharacterized Fe-S center protein
MSAREIRERNTKVKGEAALITSDSMLLEYLRGRFETTFRPGERIAVKLHMGEPGNAHYIKPETAKHIVDILRDIGCAAFIFDSPVVYRSQRNNERGYLQCAADHGYTELTVGAPIVVSNRSVAVDGAHMQYEISAEPVEADGVVLLTHVKGHLASGMGGAIKNIGMGCMSKETKGAIHNGGEPTYAEGCTQCGTCVESCPTDNIRIVDDGPRFDVTWCPGCSNCILSCPEECIHPRVAPFDDLLAEAAVLAHERFKKVFALNVLKRITKLCDCIADSGPIILGDIGYLCGGDMLSVDIASLEVVSEVSGKDDLFAEHNMRTPWGHVRAAAKLMKRDLAVSMSRMD